MKKLVAVLVIACFLSACATEPKKIDPNPERTKISEQKKDDEKKEKKEFDLLGFLFGWLAAGSW